MPSAFVLPLPPSFRRSQAPATRFPLSPFRAPLTPFQSLHNCRHVRMCASPTEETNSDSQIPRASRQFRPEVKELHSVLKKCPIYLIGPMGSGKSAVGKFLAFEIGFRYLDTDQLIEAVAKMSIAEIFEESGEDGFRDLEEAVLGGVQQFIACCVSTGGGIVLRKPNWGKMHTGIVVYLKTPVEILVDRLKGDTNRPLLKDAEDLEERIRTILEERSALYEQADVIVPVGKEPVDEIGNEVIRMLSNFIKSNPPNLSKLYPGNLNDGE